jgi:hypothetical protein
MNRIGGIIGVAEYLGGQCMRAAAELCQFLSHCLLVHACPRIYAPQQYLFPSKTKAAPVI